MSVAVQPQKRSQKNRTVIRLVPPWFIEGGFYAVVLYDFVLAPILGLEIERLGIVILAGLASLCFLGMRERPGDFFETLVFPVGLGISYIIIQYMYFGESLLAEYVKPFISWIFTLIVVQALSFRRGFLHRYAIFALILGIVVLPFLEFQAHGITLIRASLKPGMGQWSSANAMGEWFGFCTVYFYLFGVASLRQKTRLAGWVTAMGCLFVLTLTVSRTTLFATFIAIILGSREFLKRGFLPLLFFVMLAGIAYGTGIFDQAINLYIMRGTEETGRGYIWPRVMESIINSPLVGVGASDTKVFLPEANKYGTPHNTFLFIAMASGIIPLLFYIGYWIQGFLAATKQQIKRTNSAIFLLPMVTYAFVICLSGNLTFLGPWVVVTMAAAVTARIPTRPPPPKVDQRKK